MSGVVRLAEADVADLKEHYAWTVTPELPDVVDTVDSSVPKAGRWQVSEPFTNEVTDGRYAASFLVDFEGGVLVFDAMNPTRSTDYQ
jgi:hypothetical protein